MWYVDLTTGAEHPVTTAIGFQEMPEVANGVIVYVNFTTIDGYSDILRYNVSDATFQNLTLGSSGQAVSPAVSSQFIVWSESREGNFEIYARDLMTGEERRITNIAESDESPKVSGKNIVWQRCVTYSQVCDIWAYNWSTGVTTQVTNSPTIDESAPHIDGNFIVFVQTANGEADIALYDLSTGVTKTLSRAGAQSFPYVNGENVIFNSFDGTSLHIGLWHPSTDDSFILPVGPAGSNQYLSDIEGNRIVYGDDRNGNFDLFMYTFHVSYPPPTPTEVCRPIALNAKRTYLPARWNDGAHIAAPVMSFAIPAEIPVTAGNAGNYQATFVYGNDLKAATCRYKGGATTGHPTSATDVAAGQAYRFVSCSNQAKAGDIVTGNYFGLHLDNGDQKAGATTASVTLAEKSPCAGAVPTSCQDPKGAVPLVDKLFAKSGAKPSTSISAFMAVPGKGLICAENGPNGANKVQAGSVILNFGNLIKGTWPATLETTASLYAANQLTVLLSKPNDAAMRLRLYGLKTSTMPTSVAAPSAAAAGSASTSKLNATPAAAEDVISDPDALIRVQEALSVEGTEAAVEGTSDAADGGGGAIEEGFLLMLGALSGALLWMRKKQAAQ